MKQNKNWNIKIIKFLTAQTISLLGSSLVQYAIIWHITLSTSSGTMLTIATLCGFIPQIIISFFAGVWLDQYDRKILVMLSDGIIALSTFVLAIFFLQGVRDIRLLFAVLVVRSAGTGIQTPAVNSIIPQIVPEEHLMKTNGIQSTLSSGMMLLSPALSGAILSRLSLEAVLFIDVITAMIGIGITCGIKIPGIDHGQQNGSSWERFKEGAVYLKYNVKIRKILIYQVVVLILISPSAFLTPLLVSRRFGAEIWRLTMSEMTYSMGMICGGLIITLFSRFPKTVKMAAAAGAAYGAIMIGLGSAPVFAVYLIFNIMIGVTSPCFQAPITVTIQQKVEAKMHGRIFGLMQIATSCALPLGMAIFGPMADFISIQFLLLGTGCCVLLFSLFMAKLI